MTKTTYTAYFTLVLHTYFKCAFDNGWTKEKDINTAIKDARENAN